MAKGFLCNSTEPLHGKLGYYNKQKMNEKLRRFHAVGRQK